MELRRFAVLAVAGAGMVGMAAAGVLPAEADAPPAVHRGEIVPSVPKRGGAQVVDGLVEAGDHVGNRIVIGGTFSSVKLPDGSVVSQPRLAAVDETSGAFDPNFRPVVNGEVLAVEAGDTAGTVFIAGKFTQVNGVARARLAKLRLSDGSLVTNFNPAPNLAVKTMDRFGDRLFVGGDFTTIGGQARSRLAELSARTGKVSAAFTIGVTGKRDSGRRSDGLPWAGGGVIVRSVRVNLAGTRLVVMHRGDQVGGQTRWGAAVIDISGATPVLTPWRTRLWDPGFLQPLDFVGIQEGEISPDGSMFAITNYVGNYPPLHDTVIAFPVEGNDFTNPLWVTQMFDSTYGIGISDAAVYVGGHFCWTEGPASQPVWNYWPGRSGNEYSCHGQITGSVFQPQTVSRKFLAALDRTTGRALAWDPKSNNSNNGVQFIRVIDRGLILGHDGTKLNNFVVGRFGYFDLGPGFDTTP